MSNAWTDRKQRCLIKFLVNSYATKMFVKSNDCSKFVNTGEKLFEMFDILVEKKMQLKLSQIMEAIMC